MLTFFCYNIAMTKKQEIDFLSIASHELRTPISVVKGYLSMILEGDFGRVPPKLKAPLLTAYAANERIIRLVENLLGFAQLKDRSRLSLNKQKFDLALLVAQIRREVLASAARKKIKIRIELSAKKIIIDADQLMMRQLILNLLNNAIKYSSDGLIIVRVSTESKKILLSVADSGPGIDQRDLVGIFDRFIRKSVGNNQVSGFGLGLYVCKLIVRAHRGKIWAETRGKNFGFKVIAAIPLK